MEHLNTPPKLLLFPQKYTKRIGQTNNGNSNGKKTGRSPTYRHFVGGTLFAFFTLAIFFYWAAFPLLNTLFIHGYPRFAIPPSPNEFKSARYGYDWWLIWILTLNGILPLLLMMSMMENRIQEYARVYFFIAAFIAIADIVVFVWLLGRACFTCNIYNTPQNTACNDYRWCGVPGFGFGMGSTAEGREWCPNVGPFNPPVASAHLNAEYTQHIIFAGVFSILALLHLAQSRTLTRYGIFTNEPFPDDEEE